MLDLTQREIEQEAHQADHRHGEEHQFGVEGGTLLVGLVGVAGGGGTSCTAATGDWLDPSEAPPPVGVFSPGEGGETLGVVDSSLRTRRVPQL